MQIKHLIVGPIQTNCYLLESAGEIAVIDPGGDAGLILDEIKKINGEVKYIINTHHHYDHTEANQEIKNKTDAQILIHATDYTRLAMRSKQADEADYKADRLLKDGDEIKIGSIILKVIHAPGHSKGSICLLRPNFIFTGDTLFKDGYGRTDLEGGSEVEMEKSLAKLRKIIKPCMMVYPGHGEVFKV